MSPNSGNTLTLTGTAEVDSAINVYDGATLLGSAMADASGGWSYITGALGDGSHMFTVTATDAADNTSYGDGGRRSMWRTAPHHSEQDLEPRRHDPRHPLLRHHRPAYTDYDVVYGANNKPVSASYSNGMTATWTYNSDGTLQELVYNGITGQNTPRPIRCMDRTARPSARSGATAPRLQSETWNPDGTIHDIHYYGHHRPPTPTTTWSTATTSR